MMKLLPEIPDYTWRPFADADGAQMLTFEQACSLLDGHTKLRPLVEWQTIIQAEDVVVQSQVAVNAAGDVAAAGWFDVADRVDSVHGFLVGRVHPDFRGQGIGTALLLWLEEQAKGEMAQMANGYFGRLSTGCPQLLRLVFYDRAPDAIALFEQQGYERQYAEDEYVFDLKRPLPFMDSSSDLVWENWTPDNAPDFYAAYCASFATRTDNLMAAEPWARHFANPDDSEFRADLSVLLRDGEELLGYAAVHVEEAAGAWITQIGVSARQRRQGRGAAIMVRVLRKMAEAGFERALLQVNQDNPQARALYEALGFERTKTLYVYRKQI